MTREVIVTIGRGRDDTLDKGVRYTTHSRLGLVY
jgi:hypothetical protein